MARSPTRSRPDRPSLEGQGPRRLGERVGRLALPGPAYVYRARGPCRAALSCVPVSAFLGQPPRRFVFCCARANVRAIGSWASAFQRTLRKKT